MKSEHSPELSIDVDNLDSSHPSKVIDAQSLFSSPRENNSPRKDVHQLFEDNWHRLFKVEERLLFDRNYQPSVEEIKLYLLVPLLQRAINQNLENGQRLVVEELLNEAKALPLSPQTESYRPTEEENKQAYRFVIQHEYRRGYREDIDGTYYDKHKPDAHSVFNENDYDEPSHLRFRILEISGALAKLSQTDHADLADFLGSKLIKLYPFMSYDDHRRVSVLLFKNLELDEAAQVRLAGQVVEYVADLVGQGFIDGSNTETIHEYLSWGNEKILMKALARHERNHNFNVFMGQMFVEHGVNGVLNMVKANLVGEDPEGEVSFAKYLMGELDAQVEPGKRAVVHRTIEAFYKAIKMEEYWLTEQSKEIRAKELQEEVLRMEGNEIDRKDNILVIACGNGLLVHDIQQLGYKVEGLDISERLIGEARNMFPDETFRVGSWDSLTKIYGEESQAAIINDGRNARHFGNPNQAFKIIREIADTLKPGGVYEFNTPDPTQGAEGESLERYRNFLERFQFNRQWLDKYMWQTIGTPPIQTEEQYYCESFNPNHELVVDLHEANGLKLVKTIRKENYDGRGSVDITYVFVKPEGDEAKQLISDAEVRLIERARQEPKNPNGYREGVIGSGMYSSNRDW